MASAVEQVARSQVIFRKRTEQKIKDLRVCITQAKSADVRLFLSELLAEQLLVLSALDEEEGEPISFPGAGTT